MDLGSNSFHMIVGEFRHGQLAIIDRLKETVRLSEGLKDRGNLTQAARQRALDCLSRFGERLRDMHADNVRTAGTEEALGHPIEVISGIEEARLIYNGVFHSMPRTDGLRLVLDIGGGSTEMILGQGDRPQALESLHMGCVVMTETFFSDGQISKRNFDDARLAARLKLRPVKAFFRDATDIEAVGCSGTILATETVAREVGAIESNDLSAHAVEELIERVMRFKTIDSLRMRGLSERRAQVWPGGLAILVELMEVLRIERLKVSDGALREGLLYDHIGRLQHEDARDRTIKAMATRYNVDQAQAQRVAKTAAQLHEQVAKRWKIESPLAARALEWSASIHEIGLDISHIGFQRHGAYIAANADMPGFPRSEQKLVAFLIATQRTEINRSSLVSVTSKWRKSALRLAILLGSVCSKVELPPIDAVAGKRNIDLRFPPGWLDANPLTVADLRREQAYLRNVGYELGFAEDA